MFLAMTRTVLFDHSATSDSTKRVDGASAAWARSRCRAPLTVTSSRLVAPGATLLTETYTQAERARAQTANDLTIVAVGLASSLAAGSLLQGLGWQTMNVALLPWLGLAAAAIAGLGVPRRRQRVRAAT
ncbi:hypothetical protein [Neoroseomonas lacus]|nr:hypothetical protein [Neoroseomonas lacus]